MCHATNRPVHCGNGGTAPQQHPSHAYVAAGAYTVHLRVSGPGGLDLERKFDLIHGE